MQQRHPRQPQPSRPDGESGFTLIELIIVMTVIGLLAAIAIPSYVNSVRRAREAVLREDLHTMRSAIDSYTVDKEQAPQTLDDIVQAGYLKSIPVDPITNHADTWTTSQSDVLTSITEPRAASAMSIPARRAWPRTAAPTTTGSPGRPQTGKRRRTD